MCCVGNQQTNNSGRALLLHVVTDCRRDIVLGALSAEELAPLLHDLSGLRVVPLLQALLADA